ncbi:MAG: flagellar hook-basal body complex protein FliE [bacterium]|nr:flagellar hook-basal body complex protein FliE [bacterium]
MSIKGIETSLQLKMLQPMNAIVPDKAVSLLEQESVKGQKSFTEFLKESVSEVNNISLEADQGIRDAIAGRDVNPHTTMIAMQKADISFRLMMQVKQRLEQAYEQVIRTQV